MNAWVFNNEQYNHNKVHLSKLDPEKCSNTGGTGIIKRGKGHIIRPSPLCKALIKVIDEGRVGLYAHEVSLDNFVLTYIIYGWTNGALDPIAAARTDDLIALVVQDAAMQPPGPVLICGDVPSQTTRPSEGGREYGEKGMRAIPGHVERRRSVCAGVQRPPRCCRVQLWRFSLI